MDNKNSNSTKTTPEAPKNPFPNRAQRRMAAKNAGYFKKKQISNSWQLYKAPNNEQTVIAK